MKTRAPEPPEHFACTMSEKHAPEHNPNNGKSPIFLGENKGTKHAFFLNSEYSMEKTPQFPSTCGMRNVDHSLSDVYKKRTYRGPPFAARKMGHPALFGKYGILSEYRTYR